MFINQFILFHVKFLFIHLLIKVSLMIAKIY